MTTNWGSGYGSTNQLFDLATWFCRELPVRLLVIDLESEQVIAADRTTVRSGERNGEMFPCPIADLFGESVIATLREGRHCEWLASPFISASNPKKGETRWKYECLISGKLGVLYQNTSSSALDPNYSESVVAKDQLTGLGGRAELLPMLDASVARFQSTGTGFAVLFLDVDDFKKINDLHGHLAGDEVLSRASEGILHAIRPGDGAIRYGGDEVVLVIGGLHSREEAAAVGRRLAGAIPRDVAYNNFRISFTISIGIAYCRQEDRSAQSILKRADRAMYRAKNRGRCGEIELD